MSAISSKAHGVTITLQYPIEVDGKELMQVALRRPRVADMLEMQRKATNPADMELFMVALLSGLKQETVTLLDMQDYATIQATLRSFTTAP